MAQCVVESDCDDCADDKGCHNDPSVSRFQDTTSTWQMQALPGCQHLNLSVFQMDADAVHGSGKAEHGADLVDEQRDEPGDREHVERGERDPLPAAGLFLDRAERRDARRVELREDHEREGREAREGRGHARLHHRGRRISSILCLRRDIAGTVEDADRRDDRLLRHDARENGCTSLPGVEALEYEEVRHPAADCREDGILDLSRTAEVVVRHDPEQDGCGKDDGTGLDEVPLALVPSLEEDRLHVRQAVRRQF